MDINDTNALEDLEELQGRLAGLQEACGVMVDRIQKLLDEDYYDARDLNNDLQDTIQVWSFRNILNECVNHNPASNSPIDAEEVIHEANDVLEDIQNTLGDEVQAWEEQQEEDDDYDDDDDDDGVGDGLEWYEARGEPGSPDRRQWLETVVPGWANYLEHYKNSPVATTPIYTTIQQHLPAYQEELADLRARERLGL